jgi:integrase
MAEGIRKRHSKRCQQRQGKRCRCKPGEGKWEAWVYLRREGRKAYRSFDSEEEAKAWRAEARKAAKVGTLRTPTKLTVEEAAWLWLEGADRGAVRDRSQRRYKPSTLRGYRASLQLRILPEFGPARLSELRRIDVKVFVDRLLGEDLAPGTIRNTLNPLQAICRHAIENELLGVNPTLNVKMPKSRGRRDRIASAAEATRLLQALPGDERPLWATAFYAGLRRGELRALRWSDVDLGRSEIHVERSWDQYEGSIDPKSETSARTVPMLAVLRDYLDTLKVNSGRDSADLVFGRTASAAFVASTARNRALAAWDKANLAELVRLAGDLDVEVEKGATAADVEAAIETVCPGTRPELLSSITLHECRHTFASLLIDAGVNAKALSTFMGHSTIDMTFNQYGHLMPGSRDQARELVDRYLAAAVDEARIEAAAADPAPAVPHSATLGERSSAPVSAEADDLNPHS